MSRAIVPLLLLAACAPEQMPDEEPSVLDDNGGVEETRGEEGCDNLLPDHCTYPFPSGAFVDGDGFLDLPTAAMPALRSGEPLDPTPLSRFRGFGAASPVIVRIPDAVLPADAEPFDPTLSLSDDAPFVMVDAATGERIPHWVEPDTRAPDAIPPVWTLRPMVALPRGTTVVVGIRGLEDASGKPLEAPASFRALRDQTPSRWRGIHARRTHFEEVVFPTLADAGLARDELQLAWSFPTRTGEEATAALLAVRDAIFAALPEEGPEVTLDSVLACEAPGVPAGCPGGIAVIADGRVTLPSVLQEPDALGVRRLRRDGEGVVVVDGTETWPFRFQLPYSAFEEDGPVPVMQYGHGFLGSSDEANNGWLRDMADRLGFAILATSMQGMNGADATVWIEVLGQDGGRFPELAEPSMQGVVIQLLQQRMVSTTLAALDEEAFRRDDEQLAWDPDEVWYYGNSQGGSVGTLVMGSTLDVSRGVLGVPGSGYPFLLHRSTVFDEFDGLLRTIYREPDAVSRFLAVLGTGWDDVDPLTWAPHLHGDPLPDTPDHEVLFHVAKEDQQVHNEASFISARTAGAVLMTPAVRSVPLLPEQPYPASPGAAAVEVDFGIPDDPTPYDPPDGDPESSDGGDTHGWLRAWEPAQDQMVHFLATGELIDVCEGSPCFHDGRP